MTYYDIEQYRRDKKRAKEEDRRQKSIRRTWERAQLRAQKNKNKVDRYTRYREKKKKQGKVFNIRIFANREKREREIHTRNVTETSNETETSNQKNGERVGKMTLADFIQQIRDSEGTVSQTTNVGTTTSNSQPFHSTRQDSEPIAPPPPSSPVNNVIPPTPSSPVNNVIPPTPSSPVNNVIPPSSPPVNNANPARSTNFSSNLNDDEQSVASTPSSLYQTQEKLLSNLFDQNPQDFQDIIDSVYENPSLSSFEKQKLFWNAISTSHGKFKQKLFHFHESMFLQDFEQNRYQDQMFGKYYYYEFPMDTKIGLNMSDMKSKMNIMISSLVHKIDNEKTSKALFNLFKFMKESNLVSEDIFPSFESVKQPFENRNSTFYLCKCSSYIFCEKESRQRCPNCGVAQPPISEIPYVPLSHTFQDLLQHDGEFKENFLDTQTLMRSAYTNNDESILPHHLQGSVPFGVVKRSCERFISNDYAILLLILSTDGVVMKKTTSTGQKCTPLSIKIGSLGSKQASLKDNTLNPCANAIFDRSKKKEMKENSNAQLFLLLQEILFVNDNNITVCIDGVTKILKINVICYTSDLEELSPTFRRKHKSHKYGNIFFYEPNVSIKSKKVSKNGKPIHNCHFSPGFTSEHCERDECNDDVDMDCVGQFDNCEILCEDGSDCDTDEDDFRGDIDNRSNVAGDLDSEADMEQTSDLFASQSVESQFKG